MLINGKYKFKNKYNENIALMLCDIVQSLHSLYKGFGFNKDNKILTNITEELINDLINEFRDKGNYLYELEQTDLSNIFYYVPLLLLDKSGIEKINE